MNAVQDNHKEQLKTNHIGPIRKNQNHTTSLHVKPYARLSSQQPKPPQSPTFPAEVSQLNVPDPEPLNISIFDFFKGVLLLATEQFAAIINNITGTNSTIPSTPTSTSPTSSSQQRHDKNIFDKPPNESTVTELKSGRNISPQKLIEFPVNIRRSFPKIPKWTRFAEVERFQDVVEILHSVMSIFCNQLRLKLKDNQAVFLEIADQQNKQELPFQRSSFNRERMIIYVKLPQRSDLLAHTICHQLMHLYLDQRSFQFFYNDRPVPESTDYNGEEYLPVEEGLCELVSFLWFSKYIKSEKMALAHMRNTALELLVYPNEFEQAYTVYKNLDFNLQKLTEQVLRTGTFPVLSDKRIKFKKPIRIN